MLSARLPSPFFPPMPKPSPLAIVEVGTTQAVCLVGVPSPDGPVQILGVGVNPLVGIRKGEIHNMPDAVTGVRTAIDMAEKAAGFPLADVWLVISGGNVQSDIISGTVYTEGHTVSKENLTSAIRMATSNSQQALPERAVLHLVPQNYVVDDKKQHANPSGMDGHKVDARVLMVHADIGVVANAQKLLQEAHLETRGRLFSAICAAEAALSAEQRRDGALLINLGGGTTSYVVYADNLVVAAGSIPVGGDHVTNDISHAFHITFKSAEALKTASGSAVVDADSLGKRVAVPEASSVTSPTPVSLHDLQTVINARMEELFDVVLEKLGQDASVPNVVLVGGGARLKAVDELAGRVFRCRCTRGTLPPGVSVPGLSDDEAATVYGAFAVAQRELAELEDNTPATNLWGRLFGKPRGEIR